MRKSIIGDIVSNLPTTAITQSSSPVLKSAALEKKIILPSNSRTRPKKNYEVAKRLLDHTDTKMSCVPEFFRRQSQVCNQ